MSLPRHPTAVKMAVEKHAKASHVELGLLVEALKQDPDSLKFGEVALAEGALQRVWSVMAARGLLAETPKPTSTRRH